MGRPLLSFTDASKSPVTQTPCGWPQWVFTKHNMEHNDAPDCVRTHCADPEGFHGGKSLGQLCVGEQAFEHKDMATEARTGISNFCSSGWHPAAVHGLP